MSAANTSVSPASAVERMAKISQQISNHEAAMNRSANTLGAVGLIALVLLSVYFYIGYHMISKVLEPSLLVPYGASKMEANLPSVRESLVKQVNDSAPDWAEAASVQARQAIPPLRTKLEDYAVEQSDELLGQVGNISEEQFRKALSENKDLVEKGFKELAASEKLSEESLNELMLVLEQQLQTDMKAQAELLLETLRLLSTRAKRLHAGVGLDDEEKAERRIAMIARRLQLTEADPKPISVPVLATSPAKVEAASDKTANPAADEGDKTDAKEKKSE